MARRNQDHLKFTLFPFVSILLAVTGVLLFLIMLQAILMKSEDKEPEKKKKIEKEEVSSRVYERIPNLKTSAIMFTANGYEIIKVDGNKSAYSSKEISEVVTYINELVKINYKHSENEESEREHLLFVVENGGDKNYFSFFKKIQLNSVVKSYLPTGLVLLNPGEEFKLK